MPLDLSKYLTMKPAIDADVLLATQAVKDAQAAQIAAQAAYDATTTSLNNLRNVQKMLQGLIVKAATPSPNLVPVTDIPPPIV